MYLAERVLLVSPMMVTSERMNCLRNAVVCPIKPGMTRSWLWVNMVGMMSHLALKSNRVKKSLSCLVFECSSVASISENSYTMGSVMIW